jgi:hypothetical protein
LRIVRIVSLLPSAIDIVFELGLLDSLSSRSPMSTDSAFAQQPV